MYFINNLNIARGLRTVVRCPGSFCIIAILAVGDIMRGRVFAVSTLLVFVLIVATLGLHILDFAKESYPRPADCIIVLGCRVYGEKPGQILVARLNEGVRLYRQGFGHFIIVSGGRGRGENISEAEAMKRYLVDQGIEADKIIVEDKSVSTMTNLRYSQQKMSELNLKNAVIVSNDYHLQRAALLSEKIGMDGSFAGVRPGNMNFGEVKGIGREVIALMRYYSFGF